MDTTSRTQRAREYASQWKAQKQEALRRREEHQRSEVDAKIRMKRLVRLGRARVADLQGISLVTAKPTSINPDKSPQKVQVEGHSDLTRPIAMPHPRTSSLHTRTASKQARPGPKRTGSRLTAAPRQVAPAQVPPSPPPPPRTHVAPSSPALNPGHRQSTPLGSGELPTGWFFFDDSSNIAEAPQGSAVQTQHVQQAHVAPTPPAAAAMPPKVPPPQASKPPKSSHGPSFENVSSIVASLRAAAPREEVAESPAAHSVQQPTPPQPLRPPSADRSLHAPVVHALFPPVPLVDPSGEVPVLGNRSDKADRVARITRQLALKQELDAQIAAKGGSTRNYGAVGRAKMIAAERETAAAFNIGNHGAIGSSPPHSTAPFAVSPPVTNQQQQPLQQQQQPNGVSLPFSGGGNGLPPNPFPTGADPRAYAAYLAALPLMFGFAMGPNGSLPSGLIDVAAQATNQTQVPSQPTIAPSNFGGKPLHSASFAIPQGADLPHPSAAQPQPQPQSQQPSSTGADESVTLGVTSTFALGTHASVPSRITSSKSSTEADELSRKRAEQKALLDAQMAERQRILDTERAVEAARIRKERIELGLNPEVTIKRMRAGHRVDDINLAADGSSPSHHAVASPTVHASAGPGAYVSPPVPVTQPTRSPAVASESPAPSGDPAAQPPPQQPSQPLKSALRTVEFDVPDNEEPAFDYVPVVSGRGTRGRGTRARGGRGRANAGRAPARGALSRSAGGRGHNGIAYSPGNVAPTPSPSYGAYAPEYTTTPQVKAAHAASPWRTTKSLEEFASLGAQWAAQRNGSPESLSHSEFETPGRYHASEPSNELGDLNGSSTSYFLTPLEPASSQRHPYSHIHGSPFAPAPGKPSLRLFAAKRRAGASAEPVTPQTPPKVNPPAPPSQPSLRLDDVPAGVAARAGDNNNNNQNTATPPQSVPRGRWRPSDAVPPQSGLDHSQGPASEAEAVDFSPSDDGADDFLEDDHTHGDGDPSSEPGSVHDYPSESDSEGHHRDGEEDEDTDGEAVEAATVPREPPNTRRRIDDDDFRDYGETPTSRTFEKARLGR